MERVRYEQHVKAAILAAVQDARKSGKTWLESLEPAKQAGYLGTSGGLVQFVNASKQPKKAKAAEAAAPEASAPAAAPVKKTRRKRRAKRVVAEHAAPTAPVVSAPAASSLDIAALVHKTVTDSVISALESLLGNLRSGK